VSTADPPPVAFSRTEKGLEHRCPSARPGLRL